MYGNITKTGGGMDMRTVGTILLAVVRLAVALFVGTFLFLVRLALGWR